MQPEPPIRDGAVTREPRPFLFLKPAAMPPTSADLAADGLGIERLGVAAEPEIAQLVRSAVDFTIAAQNARTPNPQPIKIPVLNRRRRAARTWITAIVEGRRDAGTRHAVAHQWLPILCGTGPDLALAAEPARELVEFVRGAITACVFDRPADNLLGPARALHALESTLSVHLGAALDAMRAAAVADRSLVGAAT